MLTEAQRAGPKLGLKLSPPLRPQRLGMGHSAPAPRLLCLPCSGPVSSHSGLRLVPELGLPSVGLRWCSPSPWRSRHFPSRDTAPAPSFASSLLACQGLPACSGKAFPMVVASMVCEGRGWRSSSEKVGAAVGGCLGASQCPVHNSPFLATFWFFQLLLLLFSPPSSPSLSFSFSLSPASCDSLCLPRLSWSASPSPSPHHAPRPLPSLEAQGLGLGGLPAWARGPEWKTVVQTAPPAPTVPQGLSRVSWGLKPLPAQTPIPPR